MIKNLLKEFYGSLKRSAKDIFYCYVCFRNGYLDFRKGLKESDFEFDVGFGLCLLALITLAVTFTCFWVVAVPDVESFIRMFEECDSYLNYKTCTGGYNPKSGLRSGNIPEVGGETASLKGDTRGSA